jgi:CHAD domain-containing protein
LDFALDCRQPAGRELQRLALGQIDAAQALLSPRTPPLHDAIHEARRAMRRARAILQMLRPALGEHHEPLAKPLRDAGVALSSLRDAQAVIEAVEQLAKRQPPLFPEHARVALLRRLRRRRNAACRQQSEVLDRVAVLLAAASGALASWPGDASDADVLKGLRRGYARAARALRRARRDPAVYLHRWRQRVREHRLQLELLHRAWPEVIGAQVGEARRLARLLGAERDLQLLAAVFARLRAPLAARPGNATLAARIASERMALQAQAWALGARVFAERPGALVRRLAAYRKATPGTDADRNA